MKEENYKSEGKLERKKKEKRKKQREGKLSCRLLKYLMAQWYFLGGEVSCK